ncbi:MAG: SixA phosphatase family protein [Vicingaceae bacterium]
MKSIYLIRHAQSNAVNSATGYDRPLSEKGLKDAEQISKKVKEYNFSPTLIYCSPAKRTLTTSSFFNYNTVSVFEKSIYEATLLDLTELINAFPSEHNQIALIGHNPSISLLASYLTGDDKLIQISPCTVIKINLDVDNWNEITQGIGTQEYYLSPENLS